MKQLTLIVGLLLTCAAINAQLITKIDKITGDTSYTSNAQTIYRKASFRGTAGELLDFSVARTKGLQFLVLSALTGTLDVIVIEPGNELLLKLTNGKLVKLPAVEAVVSEYNVRVKGSYWTSYYLLNDTAINDLSGAQVQYLRVRHSDGSIDYELKEKFQPAIGKAVAWLKD